MQTLLASCGFSSRWIYIHTSLVQAVNILTISLCSTWADRGSVIKRTALMGHVQTVQYITLVTI